MTSIIEIFNEFKNFYPDIDPMSIDSDLLQEMLENIIQQNNIDKIDKINEKNNLKPNNLTLNNNSAEDIYVNNWVMAQDIIPEMLIKTNLICIKGRFNDIPINIMVDTGATCCFTTKSIITKLGVEHLIDTRSKIMIQGAHDIKSTTGTIWFLEIDLDISNGEGQWISTPISIEVNDDIKVNDDTKNYEINSKFDLILGLNFLKSYGANIDIVTKTLTLNNNIKIKF